MSVRGGCGQLAGASLWCAGKDLCKSVADGREQPVGGRVTRNPLEESVWSDCIDGFPGGFSRNTWVMLPK